MVQLFLFEDQRLEPIINVASVPQRSPFRYPGGKTWLVPRIRNWLKSFSEKPQFLIEPFTGGGIVGLTVAFEQLANKVILIEMDSEISSVWKTILEGEADWLMDRILTFDLSEKNVKTIIEQTNSSCKEMAFKTLLRNRVNHGGILAPGSGIIKYGENGKGLRSRWYPETLCKRIRNIVMIKDRIHFIEGDGVEFLRKNINREEAVFFIDPPYTADGKKAGRRLYTHNELNHENLFQIVKSLKGDFLMTYDNCNFIHELSLQYGFDTMAIPMKNTHHATMTELLIGCNLNWNCQPAS